MQKVVEILCEVTGLTADEVSDETAYATCGSWDSLKHMEMVARLEEAFDIDIEIDDVIAMETVGKIKEIVGRYLKQS